LQGLAEPHVRVRNPWRPAWVGTRRPRAICSTGQAGLAAEEPEKNRRFLCKATLVDRDRATPATACIRLDDTPSNVDTAEKPEIASSASSMTGRREPSRTARHATAGERECAPDQESEMSDPQREIWSSDALLLTPEEAARVLRVGHTTVYALLTGPWHWPSAYARVRRWACCGTPSTSRPEP
jgi:hypothetical protein